MGKLSADLQKISLLPHRESSDEQQTSALTPAERDASLEQLKVFGRDPTNAEPIFTREVCPLHTCPVTSDSGRELKSSHGMLLIAHHEPLPAMRFDV